MSTSTAIDFRRVARDAGVSLDDLATYLGISRHLLSRTYLSQPEALSALEASKILRAISTIAAHRLATANAALNLLSEDEQ